MSAYTNRFKLRVSGTSGSRACSCTLPDAPIPMQSLSLPMADPGLDFFVSLCYWQRENKKYNKTHISVNINIYKLYRSLHNVAF